MISEVLSAEVGVKHQMFVSADSIVRKIWGRSDTVLFIFAGAAAEFAVNKAVDWLYFTGKLPSDPLGRLFSTVGYAKSIVFAPTLQAHKAIDAMTRIHNNVELHRDLKIPDWAYRDVLFMLIHYSIAAHELLETKLTDDEKEEVHNVFYRVGCRMGLKELPSNYHQWKTAREEHMLKDLCRSSYTDDLFKQYKKHLGMLRFFFLVEVQKLLVPKYVLQELGFNSMTIAGPLITIYKMFRFFKADWLIKDLLLPAAYKLQVKKLDVHAI